MHSSHETIAVHQRRRRVFVTLDRPEVFNAQNEAFLRDFLDVTAGLVDRDDFDAVAVRSSCDHWGVVDQVVPVGGLDAAWEEVVAPLDAHNLRSSGECKRIVTSALETDHDRALADFLDTQARLLASDSAAARLQEAIDLFRSGGRPSLDSGWFPLGRGS